MHLHKCRRFAQLAALFVGWTLLNWPAVDAATTKPVSPSDTSNINKNSSSSNLTSARLDNKRGDVQVELKAATKQEQAQNENRNQNQHEKLQQKQAPGRGSMLQSNETPLAKVNNSNNSSLAPVTNPISAPSSSSGRQINNEKSERIGGAGAGTGTGTGAGAAPPATTSGQANTRGHSSGRLVSKYKLPSWFQFSAFKRLYGKRYPSRQVDELHRRIYLQTALKVFEQRALYRSGRLNSLASVNELSDLTGEQLDEFRALRTTNSTSADGEQKGRAIARDTPPGGRSQLPACCTYDQVYSRVIELLSSATNSNDLSLSRALVDELQQKPLVDSKELQAQEVAELNLAPEREIELAFGELQARGGKRALTNETKNSQFVDEPSGNERVKSRDLAAGANFGNNYEKVETTNEPIPSETTSERIYRHDEDSPRLQEREEAAGAGQRKRLARKKQLGAEPSSEFARNRKAPSGPQEQTASASWKSNFVRNRLVGPDLARDVRPDRLAVESTTSAPQPINDFNRSTRGPSPRGGGGAQTLNGLRRDERQQNPRPRTRMTGAQMSAFYGHENVSDDEDDDNDDDDDDDDRGKRSRMMRGGKKRAEQEDERDDGRRDYRWRRPTRPVAKKRPLTMGEAADADGGTREIEEAVRAQVAEQLSSSSPLGRQLSEQLSAYFGEPVEIRASKPTERSIAGGGNGNGNGTRRRIAKTNNGQQQQAQAQAQNTPSPHLPARTIKVSI